MYVVEEAERVRLRLLMVYPGPGGGESAQPVVPGVSTVAGPDLLPGSVFFPRRRPIFGAEPIVDAAAPELAALVARLFA